METFQFYQSLFIFFFQSMKAIVFFYSMGLVPTKANFKRWLFVVNNKLVSHVWDYLMLGDSKIVLLKGDTPVIVNDQKFDTLLSH